MNPLEKQVGGNHYKNLAIQPIEFIRKRHMQFTDGSIVKYLVRNKKRLEDLEKAYHFIELTDKPVLSKNLQKMYVDFYLEDPFFKQFNNGDKYARIVAYTVSGNRPKAKELLRKFINSGKYSEV